MTDRPPWRETSWVDEAGRDFGAVVTRELGYVWKTLRRLGVHPTDLGDQSQEVFLTAYAILSDYDATRPLRPWLFGIAYRIACRYRSRRVRDPVLEEVEVADESPTAEATLAAREDRALALRAIQSIPLGRRAVFVLSEIDEVPVPAIADALGIPVNTAYSRLRVARDEFEAAIRRFRDRERV